MPELPEIHRFNDNINQWCSGKVFVSQKLSVKARHPIVSFPSSQFKISSEVQGKELLLKLQSTDDSISKTICFNHGLVGQWHWEPAKKIPSTAVYYFITSDNNHALCFEDAMCMGQWREGSWGSDRGPDPVLEHEKFKQKVMSNLESSEFSQPIGNTLLEQKYFNGIGNYLRAEILYIANVDPFVTARDVLKSEKGEKILQLCKSLPEEVLSLGLNKYAREESEKKRFEDWLKIYGKGKCTKIKGRAMWYSDDQINQSTAKSSSFGNNSNIPDSKISIFGSNSNNANNSNTSNSLSFASSPSPSPFSSLSSSFSSSAPVNPSLASLFPSSTLSLPVSSQYSDTTKPAKVDIPPMPENASEVTQILIIVAHLHRTGKITSDEKDFIKQKLFQEDSDLFSLHKMFLRKGDVNLWKSFCNGTAPSSAPFPQFPENASVVTKVLIVVGHLYRTGQITDFEKDQIKQKALMEDYKIFPTLEEYVMYRDSSVWKCLIDYSSSSNSSSFAGLSQLFPSSVSVYSPSDSNSSVEWLKSHLTEKSWLEVLGDEFDKPVKLAEFLREEYKTNVVYPAESNLFTALNLCSFHDLRVVLLGQDPYHGPGQAHGLCFSVPIGIPAPPSLKNIFKELKSDLDIPEAQNGCLSRWAEQGVLLLNSLLTVREHTPMSHSGQGWEQFTDKILELISTKKSNVVFLLWGLPAQKKATRVNLSSHKVLNGAHPSPLSASKFFGCKHFSQCNNYLSSTNQIPIEWGDKPKPPPTKDSKLPAPDNFKPVFHYSEEKEDGPNIPPATAPATFSPFFNLPLLPPNPPPLSTKVAAKKVATKKVATKKAATKKEKKWPMESDSDSEDSGNGWNDSEEEEEEEEEEEKEVLVEKMPKKKVVAKFTKAVAVKRISQAAPKKAAAKKAPVKKAAKKWSESEEEEEEEEITKAKIVAKFPAAKRISQAAPKKAAAKKWSESEEEEEEEEKEEAIEDRNPIRDQRTKKESAWKDLKQLFVLNPSSIEHSEHIVGFDMDDTLIETKSGKVFALGRNDWKWLFPEIPQMLRDLHAQKKKVIIFTNQAGIGGKGVIDESKKNAILGKIEDISDELGFPLQAFVAIFDDQYRKPSTAMWDLMVKEYNGGIAPNKATSLYVGDAAGRSAGWAPGKKKDFSCSDRKFAMNAGIGFKTPEQFFQNGPEEPFEWGGFNPSEMPQEGGKEITPGGIEKLTSPTQEMIMFVGFPASGKSTLAQTYLVPKGYVHVNRDTLKTKEKCFSVAQNEVANGRSVVIDNTSPSADIRREYINIAKAAKIPVRCFQFKVNEEMAQHLNMFRERIGISQHVPRIGYAMYKKQYQAPTMSEGFSEIREINFVPNFKNPQHEKEFKNLA